VWDRGRPRPHSRPASITWRGRCTRSTTSSRRTRLAAAGALAGESDHGVSKSLYARDPDGIEFEVMWAVPRDSWPDKPMTARLDLDSELARWAAVDTADQ